MTVYPAQIDNSITLPSAVDNLTPVQGAVVNRLRDAILQIEGELGVKPSGMYTTVRARLDTLEGGVGNLKIIELAQDLGGTLENPLVIGIQGRPVSTSQPNLNDVLTWDGIAWIPAPQTGGSGTGGITRLNGDVTAGPGQGAQLATVIGLQGRPVSSTAPNVNQVLTWNGTQWVPGAGGGGSPFTVSLTLASPSSLALVGATIINPSFTASYSHTPLTATLTDSDGNSDNVIGSPNSFNSPHSFHKTSYGAGVTFTLTANDGATNASDSKSITWVQNVYWGAGTAGGGNQAFIQSLTGGGNQLQTSQDGTFTVNASGQKVYYAYRTGYGTASFSVGGFSGGFSLDSTTISFTNANGFTENYTLYESDNLIPGSITFTVTHP